jgi:pre-mycofactocin synthase
MPEKGVTVSDKHRHFSGLGFAPHVAGLPAQRDLVTTVMGQWVSLPVIISPTGPSCIGNGSGVCL